MSEKKSQYIEVESLTDSQYVNVFGSSVDRKISKPNLFKQIKDESFSPFIYPTIELLQAADLEVDVDNPTYCRCEETEYRLYKITNAAAGVDDITLTNGNTATYQIEYRDTGFVTSVATAATGALAVFTDSTGQELDKSVVPSNTGKALIQAADGASVAFPRKNADNTVTMRSASQYFDDIKQNATHGAAGVIKTADGTSTLAQVATDEAITPANLADLKASSAEVLAGTNTVKYVTPETLQDKFESDGILTIATVADISTTPMQAGQIFELVEYYAGTGRGGRQLKCFAGSITPNNVTTFNGTTGFYLQNINTISGTPELAGAKGDGSTDDTAAWQACVNAYSSVIGMSGAIYNVSDKITVPSNRRINLNGSRITQITDQREIFDCSSTDNVHIYNGQFLGKSEASFTNSSTSRAVAIKANSATNLSIFSNKFDNFWYSPLSILVAAENVMFCKNIVTGAGAPVLGIDVNRRNCTGATILANGIIVAENEISETAQGLIIAEGSSRVVISGNNIHNIINEHGMYIDTGVNDIAITGNIIKTCDGNGVKVQFYTSFGGSVKNVNISNNSIFDIGNVGGDGIIVYNVTPTGSPLYAENVVIANNNINGVDVGVGINVRYAKDVIVSNNQITHCESANGVFFANCERLRIDGNNINDIYNSALYIASCTGVDIVDNVIRSPATAGTVSDDYGMYILVTDDLMIRNNSVYGLTGSTKYCLYIASGTESTQSVIGNLFLNAEEYAVRFASTNALRAYRDNILSGVIGESFNEPALQSVASAATIKIPTGQRFVRITGTTGITTISAQGHAGNIVTLIFDGALTVTRGSNVQIASNFTTTLQDTLTMCSDGVNWYEISRSIN